MLSLTILVQYLRGDQVIQRRLNWNRLKADILVVVIHLAVIILVIHQSG